MRSYLWLTFFPAAAIACGTADTTEADVEAIRAVLLAELDAARAGDTEAFTAVFTDDVIVVPPNAPSIAGDAVPGWVDGFMGAFTVDVEPYFDDEIVVSGDIAYHAYGFQWTVTPKEGGDGVTERGRGIHILRRGADGSWKIAHDVWVPDAPPSM